MEPVHYLCLRQIGFDIAVELAFLVRMKIKISSSSWHSWEHAFRTYFRLSLKDECLMLYILFPNYGKQWYSLKPPNYKNLEAWWINERSTFCKMLLSFVITEKIVQNFSEFTLVNFIFLSILYVVWSEFGCVCLNIIYTIYAWLLSRTHLEWSFFLGF